jgi:hypothetical protein
MIPDSGKERFIFRKRKDNVCSSARGIDEVLLGSFCHGIPRVANGLRIFRCLRIPDDAADHLI